MGLTDGWNMIQALAAYPCAEPNPLIYALTFAPAVAPALIEYAGFGCRDILKFKLGKGTPCGRALALHAPQITPPAAASVANKLLKFEQKFSAAGNAWLIADLASETAARWASLAYKMSGCIATDNRAEWQWETLAAHVLFPGVATALFGAIVNYHGVPGHATIIGAVAPTNWFVNLNFEVHARPFFSDGIVRLTTWVQRQGGGNYDFPGLTYQPGYPGQGVNGQYHMQTQNNDPHGSATYIMYGLSEELAVVDNLTGACAVSELPPEKWSLSPLNCWHQFDPTQTPDPAGRNKRGRQPGMLDRFVKQLPSKAPRGPPGGMPRSKK